MIATVLPLHSRLPAIRQDEAEARNRLLAALDGLTIDGGRLSARIVADPPSRIALALQAGDAVVHLSPVMIAGQPASPLALTSPDLPELLVELSRLEPLIAGVERGLGVSLSPSRLEPAQDAGLSVVVEMHDLAGEPLHTARLRIPLHLAPESHRLNRPLGLAARAQTACRLQFFVASPSRAELAELEAGDIVIVPGGGGSTVAAALISGACRWLGRYDFTRGEFRIDHEDAMRDDPPSSPELRPTETPQVWAAPTEEHQPAVSTEEHQPAVSAALAELPVRLQVVLPTLSLPVATLAALAPGSVATLPVTGEDLLVTLQAEGSEIASGRLVALGAGYGVLIDKVSGRP
jgi:flagellar motor switch/type III secretory pathway protein FliN